MVPTRTQVVIVRHAREADKSTGTARIAALSLPHSVVLDFGEEWAPVDAALAPFVDGAWLLFPPNELEGEKLPLAVSADGPPPRGLIVLDGTWRQTRRMLKKLPALANVPRFALPAKETAPLRLRESTSADNRSTLEAIADALHLLEGGAVSAPLHAVHQQMVERVFRARGVWELKAGAL